MAFQSLYRRYRPHRFADVRGQEHVAHTLRNAVREGNVAHAYLFSGPRGTGKTSTARILAAALNCKALEDGEPCGKCGSCVAVQAGASLDVHELDAASNRRIDDVRNLLRSVSLASGGRTRVYILDEVHQLTAEASSALLKTLEEPPASVVFVLATTDPQRVLPTIRSRTQHYEFRLLGAQTLGEHLRFVATDAGLELADGAIDVAVRRGQGSARDALSALDQLVAAGGEADEDTAVDELVEALCERDTGRALAAVATTASAGRDPRQLAEAVLATLRDALLSVLAPGTVSLPDVALERVADQGRRLGPPATVRALDALGEALLVMRDTPDPRITMEVALVRMTRPELDTSLAALLERVERLERAARSGSQPTESPAAAARAAVRRQEPVAPSAPAAPVPGAPAPTAPAPPIQRSAAELPSRDEVTVAWADAVLDQLRPRAKGMLSNGRFVSVSDAVELAIMPNLVARAEQDGIRSEAEAALSAHFGRRVPLRLVPDGEAAVRPAGRGEATRVPEAPPEEDVDVSDLRDAPDDRRSLGDVLTDAFPGAEVVEGP